MGVFVQVVLSASSSGSCSWRPWEDTLTKTRVFVEVAWDGMGVTVRTACDQVCCMMVAYALDDSRL